MWIQWNPGYWHKIGTLEKCPTLKGVPVTWKSLGPDKSVPLGVSQLLGKAWDLIKVSHLGCPSYLEKLGTWERCPTWGVPVSETSLEPKKSVPLSELFWLQVTMGCFKSWEEEKGHFKSVSFTEVSLLPRFHCTFRQGWSQTFIYFIIVNIHQLRKKFSSTYYCK